MSALVPSAAFDFSKYKAGDVIVLRMRDMVDKRTHEQMDDLVAMIIRECRRRGIPWRMEHDQCNDEVRIILE